MSGIGAAARYFCQVDEDSEKICGALFYCYVGEGLVDKCISHFEKKNDMDLAKDPKCSFGQGCRKGCSSVESCKMWPLHTKS